METRPLALRDLDLRGARLAGRDLRDADLRWARLTCADLRGAMLDGARLGKADLTRADLRGASLRGVDLADADLSGAHINVAMLDGADTRGATPAEVDDAAVERCARKAFERARAAHAEGRIAAARVAYREVLDWMPDSDVARHGLALTSLARGDRKEARDLLEEVLATAPGADLARVDLAGLCLASGDRDAALAWLGPLATRQDALGEAMRALHASADRDRVAALDLLARAAPASTALPALRAELAPATPAEPGAPERLHALLTDDVTAATLRDELRTLLARRDLDVSELTAAAGLATSAGELALAREAERRLARQAPEARLWGAGLDLLEDTERAIWNAATLRFDAIGALRSVRFAAIGAHGPVACLTTDRGHVYAKRYRSPLRSAASVAYTHRLTAAALAHHLVVPEPIAGPDGHDAHSHGDDLVVLYTEVAGRVLDPDSPTPEQALALGRTLATLHEAWRDLPAPGPRPPGGLRAGSMLLRHGDPVSAFRVALGVDRSTIATFDAHPLRPRIESLLDDLGARARPLLEHCPTSLVHGDFGLHNAIAVDDDEGALLGVIDFDLATRDLAVWDLARALDLLAVRFSDVPGDPPEIRIVVARALLTGYTAVRALSDAERSVLPLLVAGSRLDLDATVLPLCVPADPETGDVLLTRIATRLAWAFAGCPELDP